METCSLQSSPVTTIPTSLTENGLLERRSIHGQVLRFPSFNKSRRAKKLKIPSTKAQASGKTKFSSGEVEAIPKEVEIKDENLAFVAGATGRVGSRTVRELLKLGFRVRAGVRSAQRAEALVQSVKQMKLDGKGDQYIERLELVECDLEKKNQIGPALGNASVVLCCIGASEKEVFDITGPYRIDFQAAKNLIDAATVAKVNHFIMVTSLGTNKVGFPAAILNLFWGVLIWKRKAEEALIASGIPYTIVRPGGMERPTDAYKETHNMTLSEEDTLFGGQVSNLQVAELIAFMAKNPGLSYCKVVEVIAETTAPLTPMDELLVKIPFKSVEPKPMIADAADESKPEPEPEPEPVPKPVTSKSIVETPSSSIEKEPVQTKAVVTTPLSPFTAYEDLKPPCSPSPTQSGPKEKSVNASSTVQVVSPAIGGNDVAKITTISSTAKSLPQDLTSGHSPYYVYDDLKPPTSPSPTAPAGSLPSTTPKNEGPTPTAPSEMQPHAEPKPRPLSPYAMYEDLKPPTSPTPSPRKLN